ncbi:cell division protein FtsN [Pasteurellaceae bacterium 22721_9_1]
MVQRDYAVRNGSKKKKSGVNKPLLFVIAAGIVIAFAAGLYLLKSNAPEAVVQAQQEVKNEKAKQKSQLPSRPEETWSYIKELESRTVTNNQNIQLNESQKAELKRLEEEEKAKQAALEKLRQQEEQAKLEKANKAAENNLSSTVETTAKPAVPTEDMAAKEAAAKLEQERKAAEQRKKAEQAKKAEAVKVETAKKEESKKSDGSKVGKFGLQCGAFNDRGKAENLQARLAMSGLNARITESGKWNRVLIGPVGDRAAATAAQQQASAIAGCVIIGM